MKKTTILLVIALVLTLTIGVFTSASNYYITANTAKNEEYETRINELLNENVTLQNNINSLQEEVTALESFVEQKDETINELTEIKNNITKRAHISNSFWEYSGAGNKKVGTIWFDDLSNVDKITVSYKDSLFNDVTADISYFVLQKDQNIGIVSFSESIDSTIVICNYEVYYNDGRIETILERIVMG